MYHEILKLKLQIRRSIYNTQDISHFFFYTVNEMTATQQQIKKVFKTLNDQKLNAY